MINFNLTKAFSVLNRKIGKSITKPRAKQNAIKLSAIQYEILCLIVMGKSLAEITEILTKLKNKTHSRGTIQFIINHQLYLIFEVHSISELVEKAALMGIVNKIPSMFIS